MTTTLPNVSPIADVLKEMREMGATFAGYGMTGRVAFERAETLKGTDSRTAGAFFSLAARAFSAEGNHGSAAYSDIFVHRMAARVVVDMALDWSTAKFGAVVEEVTA